MAKDIQLTALMELTKIKRGGLCDGDDRAKSTKRRTPSMADSKELSDLLKSTGYAYDTQVRKESTTIFESHTVVDDVSYGAPHLIWNVRKQ